VGEPVSRRKQPNPSGPSKRDTRRHAKKITDDTTALIAEFRASTPADAVDPSLIVKVRLAGSIADDEWAKVDWELLAHTDDGAVILFSDDSELTAFRTRLEAYAGEKPDGQKSQPYEAFLNEIDALETLSPEDRIGNVLRSEGIDTLDEFKDDETYCLDVELWRPTDDLVEVFLVRVLNAFEALGGEELSRYISPIGVLVRVEGSGLAVRDLLGHAEVASVDRPPEPDLEDGGVPQLTIDEVGEASDLPVDAVRIGIIDSGVNDGHPLLEKVVDGAFGVGGEPAEDDKGHGTAAYGDLDAMQRSGEFKPRFAIVSARVVDAHGRFPQMELAPKLIEEAIRRLGGEFGCRVINISLGDPNRPVGRRGTLWSAVLDTLSRELDVVLVVCTGNADAGALQAAHGPGIVEVYPQYLLEEANRLLDPSGALNVLTVGSLAHVNGLAEGDEVYIQPIARTDEPSPFTRVGPGIGGALKPDLVDYGGTAVFNGERQQIQSGQHKPAAGILSLHHRYTDKLFATFSGTSFAAPLVAHKVGLLIERFPQAGANFLRALLALSAEQPVAGLNRLNATHARDKHAVFGVGRSDLEAALFSEDDRVVLTADDVLAPDQFAVFELPITSEFQSESGLREIRVSLAFDPPVRRSRKDYPGVQMQFDLIRGTALQEVYDAYRALDKDEDKPESLLGRNRCAFVPSINLRKPGTLQTGTFTMRQDISSYGDTYFLVVRCLGRWAASLIEAQPYSIAVMLRHSASIRLYERMRVRLSV